MNFIGIDLEGVLVPEIWVALANKTGIEELKLTTKDISSYQELMEKRISVLNKNHIKADLLFKIASEINPYEGAYDFLSELRNNFQVIILSDTFSNLSKPIFKKLNTPTVFCHKLLVNQLGMISGIDMCIDQHKMLTLKYMNKLNFNTIAIGDSYNDIGMLSEAKNGILFRSTPEIIKKYPEFAKYEDYECLLKTIKNIFKKED